MLNIICSDTFTNEKRYIAHSIFAEFLGVPYTLDFKESLLEADYYKIILGNKTIKFHDCLFNQIPEGEDYLQEQYIPKTVSYQLKKITLLFPSQTFRLFMAAIFYKSLTTKLSVALIFLPLFSLC